jgi:hypothetical protein
MKLELAPLSLRRIRPSTAINSYKVYLDTLIGMKLQEWARINKTLRAPRRYKTLAV